MIAETLLWFLRLGLLILWIWAAVDSLARQRRYAWVAAVALAPLTFFVSTIAYWVNFVMLPGLGFQPVDAAWERRKKIADLSRLARENDVPGTWLELARLHFDSGEWQRCLDALRRPMEMVADDLDGAWMAGVSLLRLGRPEDALGFLEFVAEDSSGGRGGMAWLRYGEALEAAGRDEDSLRWFRKANERSRLIEAAVRQGKALDRLGRRNDAIAVLAAALERAESLEQSPVEKGWAAEAKEMLGRWEVR